MSFRTISASLVQEWFGVRNRHGLSCYGKWVLPRFKNVYIMHKHTSLQQKGVHKKIDFLGDESPLDSTPPPSLINQHYFLEKNKKYTYFANISIHIYVLFMLLYLKRNTQKRKV